MEIFVARQPIFDLSMNVFAYELLYRSGADKKEFTPIDGNVATSKVVNTLLEIGIDTLVGKAKAFINFTEELLLSEMATLFPKDRIVVELLEDIKPTEAVINACKRLKLKGYTLALDDFDVLQWEEYLPLLKIVDIIKVDLMINSEFELKTFASKAKGLNLMLLAEKVETVHDFNHTKKSGYQLFQGYFFSKPVLVTGKDVEFQSVNGMRVLFELGKESPDFSKITNYFERDITMTYKLLKLVNSAAYVARREITSVKQATVMLGIKELRKWTSLLMLQDMGKNKPNELFRMSLVRGRLAELMADRINMTDQKHELFLMGLLSLLDVIMDAPMESIVNMLPLKPDIKDALLGVNNIYRSVLDIIISYEKAGWDQFEDLLDYIDCDRSDYFAMYMSALNWANQIFES